MSKEVLNCEGCLDIRLTPVKVITFDINKLIFLPLNMKKYHYTCRLKQIKNEYFS